MSNVTVQEALKAAIKANEAAHDNNIDHDEYLELLFVANEKCKAAIVEIEKCEPVYMRYNEQYGTWSNIGEREYKTEIEGKHRGKILYSFPPINSNSNQEQIAIRERDRLGFSVVNVIGKLDEIIENTQEVEIDDFLHIAISIDMWNELQAALEDMPKRAAIYTSPQPRDWVGLDDSEIRRIFHQTESMDRVGLIKTVANVLKAKNAPDKG